MEQHGSQNTINITGEYGERSYSNDCQSNIYIDPCYIDQSPLLLGISVKSQKGPCRTIISPKMLSLTCLPYNYFERELFISGGNTCVNLDDVVVLP